MQGVRVLPFFLAPDRPDTRYQTRHIDIMHVASRVLLRASAGLARQARQRIGQEHFRDLALGG